jgi:formate dehydrogenase subunit gamma
MVAIMVHVVATVCMMAMFMGHIYIGTLGMKGAYSAMRNGYVDEGWAWNTCAWVEDVRGEDPGARSMHSRSRREGGT